MRLNAQDEREPATFTVKGWIAIIPMLLLLVYGLVSAAQDLGGLIQHFS